MFHKDGKHSCHHGLLGLAIIVLLSLILIALIFKVGFLMGAKSSHSWGAKFSHGSYKAQMGKDYTSLKKIKGSYLEVLEITDTGFKIKKEDKEYEVLVTDETKIYKDGDDKSIVASDKVYVEGFMNEEGQYQAKLVKVE